MYQLFLGRKHDKFGNHVQWWSNKTIETFENLTVCFINQYGNFTVDGVDNQVSISSENNLITLVGLIFGVLVLKFCTCCEEKS